MFQNLISSADIAAFAIDALRERVMRRSKDLHWAAYVGADAMLRASQERERVIQDHRERACADLRAVEKTAVELRAELATERRKLELLALHSNKTCLETWADACAEQGLSPAVYERDRAKLVYRYEHPRPSLTVDIVLMCKGSVLLIQRGESPFEGKWALPGGHVNIDERALDAAERELLEETGVRTNKLTFVGFYDHPGRDPRGRSISIAFGACLAERPAATAGDDAVDVKWVPFGEATALSFDHDLIVRDAVQNIVW